MTISLIFAMDRNRLIGSGNGLPWRLPADLTYFKKVTSGHTVIMGRKTYESIGKPLPNRRNIVVTRNPQYKADRCEIVHSLEEALDISRNGERFVIGGAELYRQALDKADKLYVTLIDHEFEGDVHFPPFTPSRWKLVERIPGTVDERNVYPHEFLVYERLRD